MANEDILSLCVLKCVHQKIKPKGSYPKLYKTKLKGNEYINKLCQGLTYSHLFEINWG